MGGLVGISVLMVLAVVAVLLSRNRGRANETCAHCGSANLVESSRQTLDVDTVEQQGGGFGGGGDIRVRTEDEITFRCNDCQQISTVRVRKTH